MSKYIIMLIAVLALSVYAQDTQDTVQVQEPYASTVMVLGSIDIQPAELPSVATAKSRLAMADQLLEQLNSFGNEALRDYQMAYYDASQGKWLKMTKSASSSEENTATAMLQEN